MNILVINCGSSSVKYQLINPKQDNPLAQGLIELGAQTDHATAIGQLLEQTQDETIDAVGHRVVHGGDSFRDAVIIDSEVIAQIQQWVPLAPLHNPPALAGIQAAQTAMPDLPHVAVFDTAFHSTLPRRSSHYAIDTELAEKHRIRRYGFHGTSHQFVAQEAARHLNRPINELRLITLHLGNGASACAIEMGSSTETSMGMTPLEGLVMGSRSGDIGAGIIFKLLRDEVAGVDELDDLLNRQSGLKGLSGLSGDLREIETEAAAGHDKARLSIAVFAHRVKKYIGAYAATMGGLDAVILTGGIGENSASMRQRILQRLEFLGLQVDEDNNQDARVNHTDKVTVISTPNSRVPALVIKTNEELMIARQTAHLIAQQSRLQVDLHIPIAVSARHLHLDKETFAALFGDKAEPTHHADLSQPGQFACKEKVTLVGPRNRIEGVRLLGPLRNKNQIEVSRTDEYLLGVDAPVRDSGRVKGSAPITLEGPVGSVRLNEGLICARRHIHMHPDDAERFGVEDKDEVEVAITGGPRDLVFCDVLVRVSHGYRLEMHIDTDEANAAELDRSSQGSLVYTDIEGRTASLRNLKTS
ncbi:acetate/propionate family kinase [Oceanicoccus sagamiensis]|uniref:Acetate kinase n=1 Tax=Oceanicoccus sagamiensis TaxID=716816 RepID=A0A1X9N9N5_9GAMM|nr:acetate/propionate family kinase [Oceanicoccus sagamiensis]ARN74356.1 acetate kinase [Oceanicoccus sagamiensis]